MSGDLDLTSVDKPAVPTAAMRQFIVIQREDRPAILSYILLVVVVMSVSTLLLRLSRDQDRHWAMGIAQLDPEMALEPIDDFYRIPCLHRAYPSLYLKLHGRCVRMVDKGLVKVGIRLDEHCKFLPIASKPPICTYKPMSTNGSFLFQTEGLRNKQHLEAMLTVLEANPRMVYFDASSGDGAFCIAASTTHNHTVCMNGNYKTIKMIVKSLVMNRRIDQATFIWNELVEKHRTLTRHYYDVGIPKNKTSEVFESFSSMSESNRDDRYQVNGIILDDLIGFFKNRTLFMRIELDSCDSSAVYNGDRFFRFVDVRILHAVTSYPEKLVKLTELLKPLSYLPFIDPLQDNILGTGGLWPNNVYFIKYQPQLHV